MWRWLLAIGLLWVGAQAEDDNPSCPDHCRCYWDQDNYRAAQCTAAALYTYSSDVYPSIQVLNLKPLHKSLSVKLAPKLFQRFRNVKILNMANCSIPQLPNDVFFGLRYVSDIDLSYNRIRSINGIVFKTLPALQTLLLRGNPLILNPFISIVSETLKELDMGDCGLKTIPVHTFSNANRLTHLSLDGNQLQTIYYQSVPNNLRYLNLASNKITNVPTKVLLSLSFLRRIDLSDNPVNCTCALMLMQDWFSGRGVALENDVICDAPEPYHGKNLNKINENELCKYELQQERQMNKLRFSSYKARDSYHLGQEFNALPTYDVLMADEAKADDAETFYSNEHTRSLGTHMEQDQTKEASKESIEETEGSGNAPDSYEKWHSTFPDIDTAESIETSSDSTSSTSDFDNVIKSSSMSEDASNQNTTSIEEENTSKNQSFEIDTPPDTESTPKATSPETEHFTTTEETEGSGDIPLILPETSSKFDILDETETFSTTTESSIDISEEMSETGSSTTEKTEETTSEETVLVTSEQSSVSPVPESSSHSESEESFTTEGTPETSSSTVDIHVAYSPETTPEPEVISSSTTEGTDILVEVTEPIISRKKVVTEGLEHYSELSTEASISNGTDDVVARSDTAAATQSVTTYIIVAVIALPVIVLILMAACRKRSPRKVRLPQDTESNLGTELQDMDTLLPKNGTENGVKVVPKANGAANPADSKSPEEVTPVLQPEPEPEPEQLPPIEEPPSRQNGATTPIQRTKAKLTVITDSIPKTPVFIHKPYSE